MSGCKVGLKGIIGWNMFGEAINVSGFSWNEGNYKRQKASDIFVGSKAMRIFTSQGKPRGTHSLVLTRRKRSGLINQLFDQYFGRLIITQLF